MELNNNEEMIKSLTSLIDETLEEFEELKKSKFAAQEISLGDSSSGIKDKSKNGDIETKKKEDDEDEDEDVEKGENEKADPDAGKFAQAPTVSKGEDEDEDCSKGENEKADPDAGKFAQAPTVSKGEDEEDEDEEKEDKMKKSIEESEDLMKSYVDSKFEAMQEQLEKMSAIIEAIADQPVERNAVPAGVAPLNKSAEETYEPLNKSDVADQLFELKKSGKEVDSMDIFKVETGNEHTVLEIANKYGLR